jgi:hypothetical protein
VAPRRGLLSLQINKLAVSEILQHTQHIQWTC